MVWLIMGVILGLALVILGVVVYEAQAKTGIVGGGSGADPAGDQSGEYSLNTYYWYYGSRYNVDPNLVRAIAVVESGEDPGAVNASDPSYGVMQILCTPGEAGKCANSFPAVNNWSGATQQKLMDPSYNIDVGTQILAWNLKTYGFPKGIAVYNSWSARKDPDNGPFRNQGYVDKVVRVYNQLKVQK